MPDERSTLSTSEQEHSPHRAFWTVMVVAALVLAAAAAAFTPVWNYDVFWHLAGGDWMLQHREVLGHDPFGIPETPDGDARWVNVHWLFQVVVAALHALGGFEALTVLKTVVTAAIMLVFALSLRRQAPTAWIILCGLAMLWVMIGRIRVRPEVFTLAFIMLTIALLESVRHGASVRRLWWMVPVMLAWVNMHGLYMLGAGLMWAAVLGAFADKHLPGNRQAGKLTTRGALAPVAVASLACLVTPWPVEVALHPILLFGRISGESDYYTYGVSELQRTWNVLWAYKWALLLMAASGGAMIVNYRRVPVAHVLWFVAFVAIAMMAVRNVGLTAPVCGYVLALHGGQVLRRVGRRLPRAARAGGVLACAAAVGALALTAGYATEWVHRMRDPHLRFGAGLATGIHAVDAARFLHKLPAEGDIFTDDFGGASAFIYYTCRDAPNRTRRRVYMDGRLEVHSLDRFKQQDNIRQELQRADSATNAELPETVRFFFIARDSDTRLSALSRSSRFNLIYLDDAGACFARMDYPGGSRKDVPAWPNFADYDCPVSAMDLQRRRWWRQNPRSRSLEVGHLFLAPAQQPRPDSVVSRVRQECSLLAIRYFRAALREELTPEYVRAGALAQAYQVRSLQVNMLPSAEVPVDIDLSRALRLYDKLDMSYLDEDHKVTIASQHVRALVQGRMLDSAERAAERLLDALSPRRKLEGSSQLRKNRDDLRLRIAVSVSQVEKLELSGKPLLERVRELIGPGVGLYERALSELRAASDTDAQARFALGDLLLRAGRTDEARSAFAGLESAPGEEWKLKLRRALCDAIDGLDVEERLREIVAEGEHPIVSYYLAVLLEQAGWYDEAARAISPVSSDDAQLDDLITKIKSRLHERSVRRAGTLRSAR